MEEDETSLCVALADENSFFLPTVWLLQALHKDKPSQRSSFVTVKRSVDSKGVVALKY